MAHELLRDNGEDPYNFLDIGTKVDQIYALQVLLPSPPSRYFMSRDAITLFCGPSDTRNRGNKAAHQGQKIDIARAILALPVGNQRRLMTKYSISSTKKSPSFLRLYGITYRDGTFFFFLSDILL